ncbi:hypothetical protein HMPREF1861_01233 [Corynebacterium kroppenstedtii]|nr:hypothetical protein HMPREF1861_01233 [Corynebacterium kroppenstedtii]
MLSPPPKLIGFCWKECCCVESIQIKILAIIQESWPHSTSSGVHVDD